MRDDARIDLAELAGDVVGELVGQADAAGVAIDLELDAAFVRGDLTLLERMIGNLVENGIRYNVRGGWLRVTVGAEAGRPTIVVENSGAGTPITDVDSLFHPFQRGDATANRRDRSGGFGLGLAIVRSVIQEHGGELAATGRPDGGLRIQVSLRPA